MFHKERPIAKNNLFPFAVVVCLIMMIGCAGHRPSELCEEYCVASLDTVTFDYHVFQVRSDENDPYWIVSKQESSFADSAKAEHFVAIKVDSSYCLTLEEYDEPPVLSSTNIGLYQGGSIMAYHYNNDSASACPPDTMTMFWSEGKLLIRVYRSDDIVDRFVRVKSR